MVENIRYGPNTRNLLDLYIASGTTPSPLVVFIHGGRWFRNDKTQVRLYNRVEQLVGAGISIASINYTYSSEAIWPAQINDVKAAFAFLRKNGTKYGYDVDRMAVWGQSSGAHLAIWAGLLVDGDTRPKLRAIISWYAPSDLHRLRADRVDDDVPGGNERFREPSPESLLIGKSAIDHKVTADAASPAPHVAGIARGAPLPDFLLMHGTGDHVVSPLQTLRLHDALVAQGGSKSVTLKMVEGARHGGKEFGPAVDDVLKFLTKVFERAK